MHLKPLRQKLVAKFGEGQVAVIGHVWTDPLGSNSLPEDRRRLSYALCAQNTLMMKTPEALNEAAFDYHALAASLKLTSLKPAPARVEEFVEGTSRALDVTPGTTSKAATDARKP